MKYTVKRSFYQDVSGLLVCFFWGTLQFWKHSKTLQYDSLIITIHRINTLIRGEFHQRKAAFCA